MANDVNRAGDRGKSSPTSLDEILGVQRARAAAEAPVRTAAVDELVANLRRSALMDQALREGQTAPDFALPDVHGRTVRLSRLLERGPVILCFYRGTWCPYCNMQLRAYQPLLPAIEEAGATLIAISPQSPDQSLSTAEKNALSFPVLSDHDNKVAAAFGLVFTVSEAVQRAYADLGIRLPEVNDNDNWRLPVPATYVIGPNRKIVLAHIDPDHRTRLEPAAALDAVRALRTRS